MRRITYSIILALFFLTGCIQEEDNMLAEPYGIYAVKSMVSSIPVDFTQTGEQKTEHAADFTWCGPSDFAIEWRLNKQTPIMDFETFKFWDWINPKTEEFEIIKGCGYSRRIVNLKANGELELGFFGGEGANAAAPASVLDVTEIKSLAYFPNEKSIRMVTLQTVYDFILEEYIETEFSYHFTYSGPVFKATD